MSRPCDTGMCDVSRCTDSDCLQPLSPYKGKHCNYLGEDMCPGIIDADGRCDYCGCDYVVLARDEENARRRGAEQYAKEHTFTPSQLLLDIRLHNTDRNITSNNVFWRRYLESRKLRIPGSIYICVFKQLSDWADRETIKRLREDMEHYKHNIEDAIE